MARTSKIFTAFTTGEISQKLSSRIDFAKYINACDTLENFLMFPQGGVTRRPGLRFVNEVKHSLKKTRLVEFEFSVTDAYILEFGEFYIRFYRNNARVMSGGSPVEAVTPYAEADLFDLHFAQSADVLYIAHKDYAPRKLSRASHTDWTFSIIKFIPPPSFEDNTDLNESITLSDVTGAGITVTPATTEDLFLAADVGRNLISGAGRGIIRSINTAASPDTVTMDIQDDFGKLTLNAGEWEITGSPRAQCTPGNENFIGGVLSLTLDANGWRNTTAPGGGDIGKYVKINSGLAKIITFVSKTQVNCEVLNPLSSMTAAASGTWTLEVESWTAGRGYPAAIGFYESRLLFARTNTQPQTIWASVVEDFENFATGVDDDDGLDFELTGQNPIRWLSPKSELAVGTQKGEFIVGATNDAALSPTNIKVKDQTTHGSSSLQPIRVGGVTIFVQRAGRKLREFVFVFENDSFLAPDLTILAEHITESGLVDIAYQQELDSVIWCVRGDGQAPTLTYQRDHDVTGWSRQKTGSSDLIESVASIPVSGKDQTWIVVKRVIDGVTKRYVEYFDEDAWSGATHFDQWQQLNTDSALIYNGAPTTTITGLSHLEGREVAILTDGAVHANKTVTGGSVTLDESASEVEVGLPYTSTLVTVRPEIGLNTGTSQAKYKGWSEIIVRLYKTLGGTINGERIETRTPQHDMDEEPPVYTEDYVVQNLGYDRHGRITITQDQPYPMTVLSIAGTLDISED